ncbi:MAG: type II toxin-antitoxin system VapC family toxin [Cyclobacteriaceae bacterium]|nr:type II toxin-antitoxin system VapC family toxin [Cyclobacteriaceae bacterium]
MSGVDFIADTNFLIALHEGNAWTKPFLDQTVAVSVITEIELLGWPKISELEKRKLKALLSACEIVELRTEIKEIAIQLRQKQTIKVPDAIIAATSIYLQLPLVTSDRGFKNIKDVELILIS